MDRAPLRVRQKSDFPRWEIGFFVAVPATRPTTRLDLSTPPGCIAARLTISNFHFPLQPLQIKQIFPKFAEKLTLPWPKKKLPKS